MSSANVFPDPVTPNKTWSLLASYEGLQSAFEWLELDHPWVQREPLIEMRYPHRTLPYKAIESQQSFFKLFQKKSPVVKISIFFQ